MRKVPHNCHFRSAWYEWYPDYSHDFELDISAGEEIAMYVNATTSISGNAVVENLSTGARVIKYLDSTTPLGGQNAEWILEDLNMNNALVAFVDFGEVTFTNCVAATDEQSVNMSEALRIDIINSDNEILTETTFLSRSSFEVNYKKPA